MIRRRYTWQARSEAQLERLAEQAGLQAQQLIKNTRDKAEKEAAIVSARIVGESRHKAEQLAAEIKEEARREAERIIREVVQEVMAEVREEYAAAADVSKKMVEPSREEKLPYWVDSLGLPSDPPNVPEKVAATDRIRVFIVGRELLFCQGIDRSLSRTPDIEVVGKSEDFVEDTMLLIQEMASDVVVVDIDLSSLSSGLDLVRRVSEHWPTLPVIILTPYEDESQILEALRDGASGYLSKDTTAEGLASAVRGVFQGERIINQLLIRPRVAQRVQHQFQHTVKPTGDSVTSLSHEEAKILGYFADGYSKEQVMQAMVISEVAIADLLAQIVSKLMANDRHLVYHSDNGS